MQIDDPRLTAYALGELEPPQEAEIEALLQNDPAAAREVADIRAMATMMRSQLATETAPALGPEHKREIFAEVATPKNVAAFPAPASWGRAWVPAAIAACVAVVAGYGVMNYGPQTKRHGYDKAPAPERAEGESEFLAKDAERATATPMPAETLRFESAAPVSDLQISTPEPLKLGLVSADREVEKETNANARGLATAAAPAGAARAALDLPTANLNKSDAAKRMAPEQKQAAVLQEARKASDEGLLKLGSAQVGLAGQAPSNGTGLGDTSNSVVLKGSATYSGSTTLSGGSLAMNPSAKGEAGAAAGGSVSAMTRTKDKSLRSETAETAPGTSAPMPSAIPAAPAPTANYAKASPEAHPFASYSSVVPNAPAPAATPMALASSAVAGNQTATAPRRFGNELFSNRPSPNAISTKSGSEFQAAKPAPQFDSAGKDQLGRREDRKSYYRTAGIIEPNPQEPAEIPLPSVRTQLEPSNTEEYEAVTDNAFIKVTDEPLSTFSIDVDTASYANVRRFLTAGELPPKGAVRIEELVNYFSYQYPQPKNDDPFSVNMEVATCPWTPTHRLLRIGLKARELEPEKRPQANLVFLIDVSGSMEPENKLPLVKKSLNLLVDKLGPKDTVGIAVYAGASGTVLEPTSDKEEIRAALDRLSAGGSTNGAAGIRLAYDLAQKHFAKGKTNRVILATDGDFNVGVTNQSDLKDLITKKAKSGVFLTVLGFGYGNVKDKTMEMLADKGNGNYAYIDTIAEGRKVLVEQMTGTLFTVAKDVKMQIEFNPAQVAGYRLIGYENRLLAKQDFNDDTKDAGEIGAGHTVTALYEVVPAGQALPGSKAMTSVDPLKYQAAAPEVAQLKDARSASANEASDGKPLSKALEEARAKATSREQTEPAGGAFQPGAAPTTAPVAAEEKGRYAASDKGVTEKAKALDLLESDGNKADVSKEALTLKLRWKAPDGDVSTKREFPLTDAGTTWEKSSRDFRWAAAVASFGMILRDSPHKGAATWASTRELAIEGQGDNADGHRIEFLELISKAEELKK